MKTYEVSWNEDITCFHRVKSKNKKDAIKQCLDIQYCDIDRIIPITLDDYEAKEV